MILVFHVVLRPWPVPICCPVFSLFSLVHFLSVVEETELFGCSNHIASFVVSRRAMKFSWSTNAGFKCCGAAGIVDLSGRFINACAGLVPSIGVLR